MGSNKEFMGRKALKCDRVCDVYFCSFASSNYIDSLERIRNEAIQTNWFKNVNCLTEKDLDPDFVCRTTELLRFDVRGYGYWIWKPQVVLQTLLMMKEGDVLLYIDAGCHLNSKGYQQFQHYLNSMYISSEDFLVFGSQRGTLERQYTKGDILHHFKVENTSSICNTGQIHATAFFVRKSANSVSIIQQWKSVMLNNKRLIDDSISVVENAFDFVENRHDQSIFSILMKLNHAKKFPISHIWSYTWKFMDDYPIWAVRNLAIKDYSQKYTMMQCAKDIWFYIKKKWKLCIRN